MKSIITRLLLVLIVGLAAVQTASAYISEKYTLSFSESDFLLKTDTSGYLSIVPNGITAGYPEGKNAPGLPLLSKDIAVNGNLKYKSFTVSFNKRLIRTNVTVAQTPTPKSTNLKTASTERTIPKYLVAGTSVYPASNCLFTAQSKWSNVGIVHFLTCPFVYNVVEKKLYFIDSMELTVSYEQLSSSSIKPYNSIDPTLLKNIVLNPERLNYLYYDGAITVHGLRTDYLVITKQFLKSSFAPLIAWKKTKGLYSTIKTVEEIETQYNGKDTQEKIKNCIFDFYKNRGLKYVLIGGDDKIVPVRDCYSKVIINDEEDEEECEELHIPADLYYSCFDGDFSWDSNGNGIYGETTDGINLTPSISITRLPASNSSDISAFVDKLLAYEKNPIWNNNILMCGHKLFQTFGEKSDAQIEGEKFYTNVIEPIWNGNCSMFYDTMTKIPGEESLDLNVDNLTAELSKGYNFVNMMTHGSQISWALEDCDYYSTHANKLSATGHTIITTIACNTNAFDCRPRTFHLHSDPCLSEAFIRNPKSGVIAYLGSSRQGWYDPNVIGTSLDYEKNFYTNLFSKNLKNKNFGTIVALAKTAMIGFSSEDGSSRWLQFSLNAVGDPEMPVFTEAPLTFNEMKVSCIEGKLVINTGVSDCRICIMSTDDGGASYYRVFDDVSTISVSDVPINGNICITKQGYIPSQMTLKVLQNTRITNSSTFDCDIMLVGDSITSKKSHGPVIFEKGISEIKASSIFLGTGIEVRKGAEMKIINTKHQ